MHVAIAKGGNILLVSVTDGIIVVETGTAVDKDMIYPCTEQAGGFEGEVAGEFIGDESYESIDEKQDYHHPFKEGIPQEMWNVFNSLLNDQLHQFHRHIGQTKNNTTGYVRKNVEWDRIMS